MGRGSFQRGFGLAWFGSRRLLATAAAVTSAAMLVGTLSVAGASTRPAHRVGAVSVLFALDAQAGTLKLVRYDNQDHPYGFTLTLKRLAPDVVWFADRPADQGGEFP